MNLDRYANVATLSLNLSDDQKSDLADFLRHYQTPANFSKYEAVARVAEIPVELIAALHWREASGDFNEYLCNGDPMTDKNGNAIPTTDVPAGLLFTSWITGAVDAIEREAAARLASGMTGETRDLPTMCLFAEFFNGEGYTKRGVPDPYVLAGTSGYIAGKYVADGVYNAHAVDEQLGVLVMLRALIPGVEAQS
jgi:lysozyme family protein